ncbi:hypothetical protein SCUCBS95973_001394 [Sporothrix curviconia]|uniref:Domain of unknown function at the cortex 1 domain-containing protein n=1 Tax=Sporothrix curviconia TaxID=1260050 RepID=A0ABP0AY77_9PEZI
MHSPDDFRIRVTAGTDYDAATHVPVPVNSAEPLHLSGPGGDVWLNVRIKNHKSEKGEEAPLSTPYFDAEPHKQNDDTYGIGLWFVPKREADDGEDENEDKNERSEDENEDKDQGIDGSDLQWGNDFDEPLRDRLPPGFGAALRIVKWWIDPGLEGDPYADRPYLYGPALSSFNRVHAALGDPTEPEQSEGEDEGDGDAKDNERSEDQKSERSEDKKSEHSKKMPIREGCGLWFGEGGDAGGRAWRASIGCPGEDTDAATGEANGNGRARMKWALGAAAKAQWRWQYGRGYGLDFYNGYLDFADLTLRLPGFHLALLRYYASDKAEKTCLRYVLRHRQTGRVYVVVVFSLVRVNKAGEEIAEEEEEGEEEEEEVVVDEDKIVEEARQKLAIHDEVEVDASDVD